MKRLYARLVLWLVRPALEVALNDRDRQGDSMWRMKCVVSVSGRQWTLAKDGSLDLTRDEALPSGDRSDLPATP